MRILPTITNTIPEISAALPSIARNCFPILKEELHHGSPSQTVFMNSSANDGYQIFDGSDNARSANNNLKNNYSQAIQVSKDLESTKKQCIFKGTFLFDLFRIAISQSWFYIQANINHI